MTDKPVAAYVQMRVPLALRALRPQLSRLPISSTGDVRWYKSGRMAIYAALRHLKSARSAREVLLPAYHCDSIIEPCEWAGLKIRFFSLNEDLTPDIDDVRRQISDDTLAALFVHYFGFAKLGTELAKLCRDNGVAIIEDAAHVDVVNNATASRIGGYGDWVLGSPRKFYPIYDGGCLVAKTPAARVALQAEKCALANEGRAASFLADWRRRSSANTLAWIGGERPAIERSLPAEADEAAPSSESNDGSEYKDPRFVPSESQGMTRLSRLVLGAVASSDAWRVRQQHYRRLVRAVSRLAGCSALYPQLPDDTVPYVFPLLLHRPERDHARLRAAGIEIWRWERLAKSHCTLSARLESQLVQVPCHQGLLAQQLEHMERVFETLLA